MFMKFSFRKLIEMAEAPRLFWFISNFYFIFSSVSHVEERLWWPIQSPNKGRKQKAKRRKRSGQVY